MPVPTSIADLSTTAASNSPAGADAIGTGLDDYLRTIQAIVKQQAAKGSDIASSTAIDVPNSGSYFVVTGTTTIAGISDDWNGRQVVLKFSGALQLTHSSGFILPSAANITTAAGDCLLAVNESTGVWRVVVYQRADGTALLGATSAGVQIQSDTRFTVGGTADAMTGTLNPAITGYTAGLRVTTTPGGANTVTGPTLNLNALGAKTIKKRDSSGSKIALAAGDYNASGPFDLEYDGTDFILLNPLPASVSGRVAQIVTTTTGAVATGTTTVPADDTIPQITEGTEFITRAITPTNASSTLVIDVVLFFSSSAVAHVISALFQDSTANALKASMFKAQTTGDIYQISFQHVMAAGTTSSTTFRLRSGPASAATLTINGVSGARLMGGVFASSITITEVLP